MKPKLRLLTKAEKEVRQARKSREQAYHDHFIEKQSGMMERIHYPSTTVWVN